MSTLVAILATAAEAGGDETADALFYVVGGALAVFAVLVSIVGMRVPFTQAAARGLMAFSALFVAATMAAAVISAG